jgi:predicted transcriptional regulator
MEKKPKPKKEDLFIQIPKDLYNAGVLDPDELLIYCEVLSFNRKGLICWMTNGKFGEKLRLDKSTVSKKINGLEDIGLFELTNSTIDSGDTLRIIRAIPWKGQLERLKELRKRVKKTTKPPKEKAKAPLDNASSPSEITNTPLGIKQRGIGKIQSPLGKIQHNKNTYKNKDKNRIDKNIDNINYNNTNNGISTNDESNSSSSSSSSIYNNSNINDVKAEPIDFNSSLTKDKFSSNEIRSSQLPEAFQAELGAIHEVSIFNNNSSTNPIKSEALPISDGSEVEPDINQNNSKLNELANLEVISHSSNKDEASKIAEDDRIPMEDKPTNRQIDDEDSSEGIFIPKDFDIEITPDMDEEQQKLALELNRLPKNCTNDGEYDLCSPIDNDFKDENEVKTSTQPITLNNKEEFLRKRFEKFDDMSETLTFNEKCSQMNKISNDFMDNELLTVDGEYVNKKKIDTKKDFVFDLETLAEVTIFNP